MFSEHKRRWSLNRLVDAGINGDRRSAALTGCVGLSVSGLASAALGLILLAFGVHDGGLFVIIGVVAEAVALLMAFGASRFYSS